MFGSGRTHVQITHESCVMSHVQILYSHVWHDSCSNLGKGCVTCPIFTDACSDHKWAMSHDSCPALVCTCAMLPHVKMYDSFKTWTWLIRDLDMSHDSFVIWVMRHDSFVIWTWLMSRSYIHMCDDLSSNLWLLCRSGQRLLHMCDMSHIHICDMTHVQIWAKAASHSSGVGV